MSGGVKVIRAPEGPKPGQQGQSRQPAKSDDDATTAGVTQEPVKDVPDASPRTDHKLGSAADVSTGEHAAESRSSGTTLRPYVAWEPGRVGLPPLSDPAARAGVVLSIVEREGPLLGFRVHRLIAEAMQVPVESAELLSLINHTTWKLEQRGALLADNPLRLGGQRVKTFRTVSQPLVDRRTLGPRKISEIPPRELAAQLHDLIDLREDERAWFTAVARRFGIDEPERDAIRSLRRCAWLVPARSPSRPPEHGSTGTSREGASTLPAGGSPEKGDEARTGSREPVSDPDDRARRLAPADALRRRAQRRDRLRTIAGSTAEPPPEVADQPVRRSGSETVDHALPPEFLAQRRADVERIHLRVSETLKRLAGRPLTTVEANQKLKARLQRADAVAALARMDDGTYSRCFQCKAQISAARLEAQPLGRLCIECASINA